jgi:hypothetical protein
MFYQEKIWQPCLVLVLFIKTRPLASHAICSGCYQAVEISRQNQGCHSSQKWSLLLPPCVRPFPILLPPCVRPFPILLPPCVRPFPILLPPCVRPFTINLSGRRNDVENQVSGFLSVDKFYVNVEFVRHCLPRAGVRCPPVVLCRGW